MITSRLRRPSNLSLPIGTGLVAVAEAAAVFYFAERQNFWPLAVAVVVAVELWGARLVKPSARVALVWRRMPAVLMGASVALIIAVSPRLVTQLAFAIGYLIWRTWWSERRVAGNAGLAHLLGLQAVMFEALFLAAGVWRHSLPEWLVLGLVWLGSYLSVYSALVQRAERAAGVMAATWSLVAAEVSAVLLLWLFMYTLPGGYLIVPQPALVLTALGYSFGSIYVSQRQGSLSRGRLTEYLLIGLILIAIVITGTPWRGTL